MELLLGCCSLAVWMPGDRIEPKFRLKLSCTGRRVLYMGVSKKVIFQGGGREGRPAGLVFTV